MKRTVFILLLVGAGVLTIFGINNQEKQMNTPQESRTELATFGAGCFWCVEAIFQDIKGVKRVVSGYSGGTVRNPTYKEVCTGRTGHAEVVQLEYDPEMVSYQTLLEAFFLSHDPTQLDRQGADIGTQYRSVIFYHTKEQQMLAEEKKRQLNAQNVFGKPVVTEIAPFTEFFPAEDYHQDYYSANPDQPYCSRVIGPKLEKFRKVFSDKLVH